MGGATSAVSRRGEIAWIMLKRACAALLLAGGALALVGALALSAFGGARPSPMLREEIGSFILGAGLYGAFAAALLMLHPGKRWGSHVSIVVAVGLVAGGAIWGAEPLFLLIVLAVPLFASYVAWQTLPPKDHAGDDGRT